MDREITLGSARYDVMDHMMLHLKNHHPKMLKHNSEDIKKTIKDA